LVINIYYKGGPGGFFKTFIGKLIINNNLFFFNKQINVHLAGIILLHENELLQKLRNNNCRLIGYQHGGGYGMGYREEKEEISLCDEFKFWNYKQKKTIHRWGLKTLFKLKFNSLLTSPTTKLILPCLSCNDGMDEKLLIIVKAFSNKLISESFNSIPKSWKVCWDPRDKENTRFIELNATSNDIYIFIGITPSLIWFCIKHNIKFFIIDDGSFDYTESINFEGFQTEAIDYIKYLKTKIITKNEKNVYNI